MVKLFGDKISPVASYKYGEHRATFRLERQNFPRVKSGKFGEYNEFIISSMLFTFAAFLVEEDERKMALFKAFNFFRNVLVVAR